MRAPRLDEVPTQHTPAIVAALGAFVLVLAYWSFVRPPRNVIARVAVVAICAFTVTYALVTLEIDYSDPESVLCLTSAVAVTAGLLYEMRASRVVARRPHHDHRRLRVQRRSQSQSGSTGHCG